MGKAFCIANTTWGYNKRYDIMIIYINNLIIIALNIIIITKIKEEIECKFKIKNLSKINYVLGV